MAQPAGSRPGADWAEQTTDTIVRLVGTAREKTTGPLLKGARAVVYGLLAAICGIAALVLVIIIVVRVLDIVVPGDVWAAYLILGVVFCLAGLLVWRRRTTPEPA